MLINRQIKIKQIIDVMLTVSYLSLNKGIDRYLVKTNTIGNQVVTYNRVVINM